MTIAGALVASVIVMAGAMTFLGVPRDIGLHSAALAASIVLAAVPITLTSWQLGVALVLIAGAGRGPRSDGLSSPGSSASSSGAAAVSW